MEKRSFFAKLISEGSTESATRLVFLVGSLWSMAFTTAYAYTTQGADAGQLVALFAGMFGPFAALKFSQKIVEKPNKQNETDESNS